MQKRSSFSHKSGSSNTSVPAMLFFHSRFAAALSPAPKFKLKFVTRLFSQFCQFDSSVVVVVVVRRNENK